MDTGCLKRKRGTSFRSAFLSVVRTGKLGTPKTFKEIAQIEKTREQTLHKPSVHGFPSDTLVR